MSSPEHPYEGFKLLTRDQFREGVFARDGGKCIVCASTQDLSAHHIIERRLWPNGGYFLENGASLCEPHHIEAESTTLSCTEVRDLVGIKRFPIPEHLYRDQDYDKWGNPILPNGMRLKGDLFEDASVQKILYPVLHLFTDKVKYPRTYHLPWSPGATKDDRILPSLESLVQSDPEGIVATVKMDGENTTFYTDYVHARSIEYDPHPSRSMVKAIHARVAADIPKGWRVCGENLYAKHSIHYSNLTDYFQVFSIWNDKNVCLAWEDTVEWAQMLGLHTVPVIYRGEWNDKVVRALFHDTLDGDPCEGYVVRHAGSFHYREFRSKVGKYVRSNHVTTHGHWMRSQVIPNKIGEK